MNDRIIEKLDKTIEAIERIDGSIPMQAGDHDASVWIAKAQTEFSVAQLHHLRAQYVAAQRQEAINESVKNSTVQIKRATWVMAAATIAQFIAILCK